MNYEKLIDLLMKKLILGIVDQIAISHSKKSEIYITYLTSAPFVEIPDWLHKEYPEDITIVIGSQYSNLKIYNHKIYIRLSFHNREADLVIPVESILHFYDKLADFHVALDTNIDFGYINQYIKNGLLRSLLDIDYQEDLNDNNMSQDIKNSSNIINFDEITRNKLF